MVEPQPSKLMVPVRSRSPAPGEIPVHGMSRRSSARRIQRTLFAGYGPRSDLVHPQNGEMRAPLSGRSWADEGEVWRRSVILVLIAANAGAMIPPVRLDGDSESTATLVGAGDIASCWSEGDKATAELLESIDGTIFTAGDNSQDDGSPDQFEDCFGPSWGRYRDRTKPVPGNHDYLTTDASGYFNYFGQSAGPYGKGYYSYNLGEWHIVALNSNCWAVGGCYAGSVQEQWLRDDLDATDQHCVAAYWHHPLFTSSDGHGPELEVLPLFQALYDHGAEIVMTGHNHGYERFAPLNPEGQLAPDRGIREFVVGTGGGGDPYGFGETAPNSEERGQDVYGVLRLTLRPDAYDWKFIPVAGDSFTDEGSEQCH